MYVSLGSTGDYRTTWSLVRELVSRGWRCAVTGTDDAPTAAFGDSADAVTWAPFANVDAVLAAATIGVSQCGAGTVYQALRHGVPSVVMPESNFDHLIHAEALVRCGAGLRRRARRARPRQRHLR